ncbi:MAG TPA: universal stress protein [Actinobacteria bacterium]|nr:universal stress protein [Actinomycetota bacterium]
MTAKPIVTGVDGSEESLRAAAWAAQEAELRHTPLVIVSVLPPLPWLTPPESVPALTTAAREGLELALAMAAERAKEQVAALKVETELLSGRPGQVLAERAAEASMLVVSSSGADGFAAATPGSVSRYAAAHAPCPVVVVRGEATATHREVVVGVSDPDLPDAAAALGFGFAEAALRGTRLVAVSAWYWPVAGGRVGHAQLPGDAPRRLTEALASYRVRYPGLEVSGDVVSAHPGRVLAGASTRADLVVLGRPEVPGQTTAGLGSVTHAVLNHAHGPVAIIPIG